MDGADEGVEGGEESGEVVDGGGEGGDYEGDAAGGEGEDGGFGGGGGLDEGGNVLCVRGRLVIEMGEESMGWHTKLPSSNKPSRISPPVSPCAPSNKTFCLVMVDIYLVSSLSRSFRLTTSRSFVVPLYDVESAILAKLHISKHRLPHPLVGGAEQTWKFCTFSPAK